MLGPEHADAGPVGPFLFPSRPVALAGASDAVTKVAVRPQESAALNVSSVAPTRSQLNRIRAKPSEINAVFHESRAELWQKCASLELADDAALLAVLCMLVSHRMVPYGQSGAITLTSLLKEPHLDCDNYAGLAGHLYALATSVANRGRLCMSGFYGGAVGGHCQMIYEGSTPLFLDPTIGLAASASYDDVLSGTPINSNKVLQMYAWSGKTDSINSYIARVFVPRVVTAVLLGRYRPSDAFYFFGSAADWQTFALGNVKIANYILYYRYLSPGGETERLLTKRKVPVLTT
jgi:hypothetical protein